MTEMTIIYPTIKLLAKEVFYTTTLRTDKYFIQSNIEMVVYSVVTHIPLLFSKDKKMYDLKNIFILWKLYFLSHYRYTTSLNTYHTK